MNVGTQPKALVGRLSTQQTPESPTCAIDPQYNSQTHIYEPAALLLSKRLRQAWKLCGLWSEAFLTGWLHCCETSRPIHVVYLEGCAACAYTDADHVHTFSHTSVATQATFSLGRRRNHCNNIAKAYASGYLANCQSNPRMRTGRIRRAA